MSELLARGPDILRVAHHEVMDITNGAEKPPASNSRTRTEEQQAVLTMLTPIATGFSRALLAVGTSIVLCFFILTSGSGVGRAVLVAVRGKRERRAWLRVCSAIRQQASRYLYLVTIINIAFGVVTGALLWALDVKDAAAYGVIAGLFNFMPIIGALISAALILVGSFRRSRPCFSDLPARGRIPAVAYHRIAVRDAATAGQKAVAESAGGDRGLADWCCGLGHWRRVPGRPHPDVIEDRRGRTSRLASLGSGAWAGRDHGDQRHHCRLLPAGQ